MSLPLGVGPSLSLVDERMGLKVSAIAQCYGAVGPICSLCCGERDSFELIICTKSNNVRLKLNYVDEEILLNRSYVQNQTMCT